MYNLILKDILVQKKRILFGLFYVLFFVIAFQSMGSFAFTAGVIGLTYMLVLTSCAYDDMNKSDIMLNSLPVTRKTIVLSKYMLVYIFAVASGIFYLLVAWLSNAAGLPFKAAVPGYAEVLGTLVAIALLYGIYFPVFFKVGYIKTKVLNFIMFFVFFFGTSLISEQIMKNQDSGIVQGLEGFVSNRTDGEIALMIIIIIFLITAASFLLSLKFYKNREF